MDKQFDSFELYIMECALEAYIHKMEGWRDEDMKKGDKNLVACEDIAIQRVNDLKDKVAGLKKETK